MGQLQDADALERPHERVSHGRHKLPQLPPPPPAHQHGRELGAQVLPFYLFADRWAARDQMGLLIKATQQELTAVDDRTVVVRFAEKRGRDVPLFVAALPIFSETNPQFDVLQKPFG